MKGILEPQEKYYKSSQLWPKRIAWLLIGAGMALSLMITLKPPCKQSKEVTILESEDMLLKKATKKLRTAGIEHIEIRKGLWGPMLFDPRMTSQKGRCYDTAEEAVEAALRGERPTKMEVVENVNKKRR